MDHLKHLFLLADAYRAVDRIAEATLSTRIFADGKRLAAIRNGSDIGVRRLQEAVRWFATHWPEDADWPSDVPRPRVAGSLEAAE